MHPATRNLLTALSDLHAHREWLADGESPSFIETISRVERVEHTIAVWVDHGCPDRGESVELEGDPDVSPDEANPGAHVAGKYGGRLGCVVPGVHVPPLTEADVRPAPGPASDQLNRWHRVDETRPGDEHDAVYVICRDGHLRGPSPAGEVPWGTMTSGRPTDALLWRYAMPAVDQEPGRWRVWVDTEDRDDLPDPDTTIRVLYRGGVSDIGLACVFDWDQNGGIEDVIAWTSSPMVAT